MLYCEMNISTIYCAIQGCSDTKADDLKHKADELGDFKNIVK